MTELMELGCDKHNVVKFIGWYKVFFWTKVLVFEMLDINLKEFCSRFGPLPLCKIRPVVQQVQSTKSELGTAPHHRASRALAFQYPPVPALSTSQRRVEYSLRYRYR